MVFQWQRASQSDVPHIFSLILNGARYGHFETAPLQDRAAYRRYLESLINLGVDARGIPHDVYVGYSSGQRIAASIVMPAIGTPDIGVEIAMIAVKNECRGLGYGTVGLDHLLEHYLRLGSVYVRCLPASIKLQAMLSKRGFMVVGHLGQATIFRHAQTGHAQDGIQEHTLHTSEDITPRELASTCQNRDQTASL